MNIDTTDTIDRLKALQDYLIYDPEPNTDLDSMARMASYICKTPIALISFFDGNSHWVKSKIGLEGYDKLPEIPFFQNTIENTSLFEVEDTSLDQRYTSEPLVDLNQNIRFFAGMPLINPDGCPIGVLGVLDSIPRILDQQQRLAMGMLAKAVISYLEMGKRNRQLHILLDKAQRFHNLFNNSNEIHCITNSEGTVEFVNDSIEQLLGYSPEESLGRNIWEFCIPGERDRVMPTIQEAIQRGENSFQIETMLLTKNGQIRWFSWSDIIKEGYWLVNGRDITESKEKELQLQTLSMAVEKSSVGVLIRNEKHEVEWMNPALEEILGYKSPELRGKAFGDRLIGKDTDPSVFEVAKKALVEKKPYEVEILLYKKDGTPIWLFLSNNPLYDFNNHLERQICIAVDITERKNAEIALIKTRDEALNLGNAKENFLSVMSH